MVAMPAGRPAGMVASAGCEVTTAGWVGCEVKTTPPPAAVGIPVTTPRELVSVRKLVMVLEYVYVLVLYQSRLSVGRSSRERLELSGRPTEDSDCARAAATNGAMARTE